MAQNKTAEATLRVITLARGGLWQENRMGTWWRNEGKHSTLNIQRSTSNGRAKPSPRAEAWRFALATPLREQCFRRATARGDSVALPSHFDHSPFDIARNESFAGSSTTC